MQHAYEQQMQLMSENFPRYVSIDGYRQSTLKGINNPITEPLCISLVHCIIL